MKVFITGTGTLNSIGNSTKETFDGLLKNKSGVEIISEWKNFKGINSFLGAPVAPYDVSHLPRASRRSMSRMSEMATLATIEALTEANLENSDCLQSQRTLLIMGSTSGSPITLEQNFRTIFQNGGPEGILSTGFLKIMNHTVAANVAGAINFKGSLLSTSSACTSSSQAIALGWELLQTGFYDKVIAGGADELHFMSVGTFDIVFAASRGFNDKPNESPRPFDRNRDGLVVSEGAGVVIMETEKSIQARNSTPLCEVLSASYICEGSHMTQNNNEAISATIIETLRRANVSAEKVDYVNAHGTGTIQGDHEEAIAIKNTLGNRPYISSIKGHMGHSLAACGAIEVIMSSEMLRSKKLIPTKNLVKPDEIFSNLNFVMGEVKECQNLEVALSSNAAFGGVNSSILLSSICR